MWKIFTTLTRAFSISGKMPHFSMKKSAKTYSLHTLHFHPLENFLYILEKIYSELTVPNIFLYIFLEKEPVNKLLAQARRLGLVLNTDNPVTYPLPMFLTYSNDANKIRRLTTDHNSEQSKSTQEQQNKTTQEEQKKNNTRRTEQNNTRTD